MKPSLRSRGGQLVEQPPRERRIHESHVVERPEQLRVRGCQVEAGHDDVWAGQGFVQAAGACALDVQAFAGELRRQHVAAEQRAAARDVRDEHQYPLARGGERGERRDDWAAAPVLDASASGGPRRELRPRRGESCLCSHGPRDGFDVLQARSGFVQQLAPQRRTREPLLAMEIAGGGAEVGRAVGSRCRPLTCTCTLTAPL